MARLIKDYSPIRRKHVTVKTQKREVERARKINLSRGLGDERIGKQEVLIKVEAPEIVKEVSRTETPEGTIITGYTRADIVRMKGLERQEKFKRERELLERNVPSARYVSGVVKGEVLKPQIQRLQKPIGFVEPKKISRLEETRRKLIGITTRTSGGSKEVIKRTGSALALGGLGVVRGVKGVGEAVINPIKFAKEQASFVKALVTKPKETISDIKSIVKEDPTGFIAEFYTFNKAMGLAGKGVKDSPAGRYVKEELFIRSQPKELQKPVREIIKSAKVQEKINPGKGKKLKVNFAEVKNLNSVEARALRKTLKNDPNSFVFGSVSARTFSQGKTKIPKDVDLATKSVSDFNKRFFANLPSTQKLNYIIKGEKIIRKSDNTPILDVKPVNRLIPEKSLITGRGKLPVTGEKITFFEEGSYLPKPKKRLVTESFTPTQKIESIGGIRLVGFGEQTTRKALGTLQVLLEKNVKRAKDPSSFVESIEIQLSSLKKSKPKTKIGKVLKNRKVKRLEDSLKVLKSKEFIKLLNKKVPGLTKEYPILTKIDTKKLKEAQSKKQVTTKEMFLEEPFTFKTIGGEKKLVPKLEKPSIIPSKLPKSKVPSSKVPISSVLKRFKPSQIKTSKLPSKTRISQIKPSKTPSKPSIIPSKVPSTIKVSKLPKSIIPSRLPSKIPSSKVPVSKLSKLPITKGKLFKTTKLFKLKKDYTKTKPKKYKKKDEIQLVKFTTTIIRPSKPLKFKEGELPYFTGLELR